MLDLELTGKVAIITGASDGLGLATAKRFAEEGVKLAICARTDERLQAAARELRAAGAEVVALATDVTDASQIERLVAATVEAFGGVDILVNNAGRSAATGLEKTDDALWEEDIALKLMASVRLCRHVIPLMRARGGGAIVNATTIGGKAPAPRALPTSVTRAAGINLTKALALEYAHENIRVNTVCIGLIKSAQWERKAAGAKLDELYDTMSSTIPMGRVGESGEFADAVAFLCSARASYVTGTSINVDGGKSAVV
jgi:3-oxoacyl-[acyl-carrier protein] reductase